MINLSMLKIRQKLILYILPLIILPSAIIAPIMLSQWSSDVTENVNREEEIHIEIEKAHLETFLQIPLDDISFLRQSPAVMSLAQALTLNDTLAIEEARILLEDNFVALSGVHDFYQQLRFIDATGLERVRVDYDRVTDSTIRVTNLQNTGDRGYFTNTIAQPDGGLYISDLVLYREGTPPTIQVLEDGSVVPVLRYGTPIYFEDRLVGIVVINVLVQQLLDQVTASGADGFAYLFNLDGYYLVNTRVPTRTFGFEQGIEAIGNEAGANVLVDPRFFTIDDGARLLGIGVNTLDRFTNTRGHLVHVTRVNVAPEDAPFDYYFVLATTRDEAVIYAEVQQITILGFVVIGAVSVAGAIITFFVARQLSRPIRELGTVAQKLATGDFNSTPSIALAQRQDELGDLSRAFITMSNEIKDVFTTLESRVAERTQDLQTSAEIAASANQIRDINDLLSLTVNLIRDRFNFYYTQVYVIDATGEWAELRDGTGYVGRKLLARQHKLPLNGRSLVATAISTQKSVIVQDTKQDSNFLPNELLPDTRSEVTIPLRSKERVIGVLDIQHNIPNTFTEDNIRLFQSMADQLAVTFENVRAFDEIARAKAENDRLFNSARDLIGTTNFDGYFLQLNPAWETTLGFSRIELMAVPYVEFVHPDDVERTNHEANNQLAKGFKTIAFENRYRTKDGDWRWLSWQSTPDVEHGMIYFIARDITDKKHADEQIRLALKQVEDYRFAIDQSAIVAFTDQTGKITYANDQFCQISKYSREELIGQDHRIINSGYHDKTFMRDLWVAIANGKVWRGEIRNKAKDGSHYWVDTTIVPTLSEDGKPIQYIAIRYEITERKEQELEIQKRAIELQTVAQVSAEATSNLNINDLLVNVSNLTKERFGLYHAHIYLMNEAGTNLVLAAGAGQAGQQMVKRGHKIPLIHTQSIVAICARNRQGVIVNDVTETTDFLPNPLLPETVSEMAVPLIVGDKVIGVLDVQSQQIGRFGEEDVRIKTILADQIAVAIQNARFFQALEEQATTEREIADKLRDVDRLKSQFLANMSHELRTPLNSIIGYSEVLLDGVDGELTPDAEEDVQAIHDSGKHLLALINEILDLAKIEAGEMRLERKPLDLVAQIKEIVQTAQVLVKDKPVTLEMVQETAIPSVNADQIRLRQIIWNLVSNAVKFTESGSVRVHLNRTDEKTITVAVRDTGIGISKDNVSNVFERFSQVDGSSTRLAGGTGLGLTITKQLIELHDGDIFVESELGSGSVFWFTMPVHETALVEEGEKSASEIASD